LPTLLVRQEPPPSGVVVAPVDPASAQPGEGHRFPLKLNRRTLSPLAFSLWILRRLRSLPGSNRLEVSGESIPLDSPSAIDILLRRIGGPIGEPRLAA
jgi:hypothetical protein